MIEWTRLPERRPYTVNGVAEYRVVSVPPRICLYCRREH